MKKIYLLPIILLYSSIIFAQFTPLQKLVAHDREIEFTPTSGDVPYQRFGNDIAISGDYAIVGANNEDFDEDSENPIHNAGAAYVFKRNGNTWTQIQKIVASDRQVSATFGTSIAIDGDYAVIGAQLNSTDQDVANHVESAGAVYVFKRVGDLWTQHQKIVANDRTVNSQLGIKVGIKNGYIIASATGHRLNPAGESSLANAGAVYIFKQNGTFWEQQQKIVSSNRAAQHRFGTNITINETADVIMVGTNTAQFAYAFSRTGETWAETQLFTHPESVSGVRFSQGLAIQGNIAVIAAPYQNGADDNGIPVSQAGAVFLYEKTGETWTYIKKITASNLSQNLFFGTRLLLKDDLLLVGVTNGTTYILKNEGENWNEDQIITAHEEFPSHEFGTGGGSLDFNGDYLFFGYPNERYDEDGNNEINNAGAVYVYQFCNLPVPEVEGVLTICVGESTTLEVNTAYEVRWYDSEEATESIANEAVYNTANLSETTSFWVEIQNGVCISERVKVEVTVSPLPELSLEAEEITICSGDQVQLNATTNETNTVRWYATEEAEESLSEGTNYTVQPLETTIYWAEAFNIATGCRSARTAVTITVNPIPVLNISATEETICAGDTAEFTVTTDTGNAVNWYLTEDATEIYFSGAVYTTGELTETTTYWVEVVTASGCESERTSVTVTVIPAPNAPQAVAVQYFTEGQTLADLVVDTDGTLTWYADEALTIVLPETTPLVNGTTYYVTQAIGECESAATAITVELHLGIGGETGSAFTHYPNPVKDYLNITSDKAVKSISVYDISGRKALNGVSIENGKVNTTGLPAGTYVFRVVLEDGKVETFKIIKK